MGTVTLCGPARRGCEPQQPDLQWPGRWNEAARLGPSTNPWGLSWPAAPVLRAGSPHVYMQPGRVLISSPPPNPWIRPALAGAPGISPSWGCPSLL